MTVEIEFSAEKNLEMDPTHDKERLANGPQGGRPEGAPGGEPPGRERAQATPGVGSGLPPRPEGTVKTGEDTPTDARGGRPGPAAAAAEEGAVAARDGERPAPRPGQAGGGTEARKVTKRESEEAEPRGAEHAEGRLAVAEEDDLTGSAELTGTGGDAAAQGAVGAAAAERAAGE